MKRCLTLSLWCIGVGAILMTVETAQAAPKTLAECAEAGVIEQITCFTNAAKRHEDLTVCDQAEHTGVRYQCYALYAEHKQDPAPCRRIPTDDEEMQSLADVCLSDVAALKKDPQLCAEMETVTLRDDCYSKVAREVDNTEVCKNIRDEARRNFCQGIPTYME